MYAIYPKYSYSLKPYHTYPKNWTTKLFLPAVGGRANTVDTD